MPSMGKHGTSSRNGKKVGSFQNGGIAFVVLNLTFESPFSDVGVMPVVAFFICSTGPIMFVVYAIYEAYRYA